MEEGERQIRDGRHGQVETRETDTSCGGRQSTVVERNRNESTQEDETDSKLDVSSVQFDPLLALYSPQISLPFPDIKCFNNIAEYESFLKGGRGRAKPENVEKRLRKARKGVADPERIERLKKLMVNAEPEEGEGSGSRRPRRKQKAPKNVLTRMPLHAGSPLGELHRCVQERIRVKVHIRTFKGLRGVCSGFVVAFDKFWNLAMVDVDETFRKPLLGEAIHHERALTVTRLFDKLKLQESTAIRLAERKKADKVDSQETMVTRSDVTGDRPAHLLRRSPRKSTGPDPKAGRSSHGASERDRGMMGAAVERPGAGTEKQPGEKAAEPRVDYQWVHTRHINQLFIRGENVLLINVHQ
ncbi:hypothetical protein JZ751_006427 [Albula glossodonta]|uniref:LSM11, U7 small nuclear RNA associated n=1 Tax=Albula glossodonta TaxID=121402 RepID=A0A8T2NAQ5_9TELE|nr:hypothetical protein JZ751_006427 [Albula glossodonta]